ncbi:MAG: N-acylglucosamine 2-epimerase, partial [Prevotella sp.]|nr:N-acylglucosamine 2-epimerase [Prevotella sp.]
MDKKKYLEFWAKSYKEDLTKNIMPFWMRHGWDKTYGGVYTCV